MKKMSIDKLIGSLIMIILILLAVVAVIPLINVVALSLSSRFPVEANQVTLVPVGFTFDSWRKMLSQESLWASLGITFAATAIGTIFGLAITACMAYPLSKPDFKATKVIMLMVAFTMIFKAPIVPKFLVLRSYGFFNNPWAMVFPYILNPFNLVVMRTFFQGFPKELEESAMIDGANRFLVFLRIVLPSSKAVIATVGLFYAVALWNQYETPLMFIQNDRWYPLQLKIKQLVIDDEVTKMVSGGVVNLSSNYSARTLQAVVVVFAIIPVILVYPYLQKHFAKGAMVGSVKG